MKKGILRTFTKFTGIHLCQSLEFCEISKNTFFTEHLWTAASDLATPVGVGERDSGWIQIQLRDWSVSHTKN